MLSAIVQQVTGQTVFDYLQPRIFRPLAIRGIDWDLNPQGINLGMIGLRLEQRIWQNSDNYYCRMVFGTGNSLFRKNG